MKPTNKYALLYRCGARISKCALADGETFTLHMPASKRSLAGFETFNAAVDQWWTNTLHGNHATVHAQIVMRDKQGYEFFVATDPERWSYNRNDVAGGQTFSSLDEALKETAPAERRLNDVNTEALMSYLGYTLKLKGMRWVWYDAEGKVSTLSFSKIGDLYLDWYALYAPNEPLFERLVAAQEAGFEFFKQGTAPAAGQWRKRQIGGQVSPDVFHSLAEAVEPETPAPPLNDVNIEALMRNGRCTIHSTPSGDWYWKSPSQLPYPCQWKKRSDMLGAWYARFSHHSPLCDSLIEAQAKGFEFLMLPGYVFWREIGNDGQNSGNSQDLATAISAAIDSVDDPLTFHKVGTVGFFTLMYGIREDVQSPLFTSEKAVRDWFDERVQVSFSEPVEEPPVDLRAEVIKECYELVRSKGYASAAAALREFK